MGARLLAAAQRDGRLVRYCDAFIQGLIALTLVASAVETLPNLSTTAQAWLHGFDLFSVAVFTVEYLLRIYFARPRRQYIFSFFGIIDLLAILPFYVGLGVDVRSIRAFRLLRLLRILKVARYSAAVQRFYVALRIAKEELIVYLSATLVLLYLSALGIYYFEHDAQPDKFTSVFDALWWAVATFTTVGYGDVYPVTAGGRLFTFFVLLIGLGIVSVPTGIIAAALAKARQMEDDAQKGSGDATD
jgi:voltage-gated potassium channel